MSAQLPALLPRPLNSSFSTKLPTLQLGIDSTSLGEFKICPRRYYYSLVEGWQTRLQSAHLVFGIALHKARETYDYARSSGAGHEDALDKSLGEVLQSTWNSELGRPWLSDIPIKTRVTLVRTVVWYLDTLGQDDPLQTVQLANGRPAVELSFRFDSGYRSRLTGEAFLFCGHLDRIARFHEQYYIVDIKTTGHSLDERFFGQFTPDNQMSLYALAGRVGYSIPVSGLIIDGVQIGVGFSRFSRFPITRDEAQINEWYEGAGHWLAQIEHCAATGSWPQNDKSCGVYGGCQFRKVCSRSPVARQTWLEANFTRRVWDPLVARGET